MTMRPGNAVRRRRLLRMVFDRENGRCFYCDHVVSMNARRYLNSDASLAKTLYAATLDHIIPKSRGGMDTIENTVCACYGCNTSRKDGPAIDFLYSRMRMQGCVA